ncbi:MAG: clostripain-related cysteine peptidase [Peptococcaceae bacterium]|nr:clostripain-related cysteine peptidase [Peptococcaceae bacterium]
MRKLLLVVFIIVNLFTLASCSDVTSYENIDLMGTLHKEGDTWAIYWYLCGSDLESEGGFASADLEEMLEVVLPEEVTVVVETGGAAQWHNEAVQDSASCRFLYRGDQFELLDVLSQRNMGDSKTLEDFLRFCNTEYPADHQAVIIWNHGGGSLSGAAFDELYEMDSLSLTEMHTAFDNVFSLSEDNPPLEMIGFDACLMATIDTANNFRDIARYMVASEESEPGCGWDYTGFLKALADEPRLNGAMLGKVICDTYAAGCSAIWQDGEITLSVIDLTRIGPLLAAYHNTGVEALAAACDDPEFLSYFGRGADSAEKYGPNDKSEGYTNMVDFGDLSQVSSGYLPKTAHTVDRALKNCVVYTINGSYRSQARGLSCYYPYDMGSESFKFYSQVSASPARCYLYEFLITGQLTQEGSKYAQTMQYMTMPEFKPPSAPRIGVQDTLPVVPSIQGIDLEDYPVSVDQDGSATLNIGTQNANVLSGVYFELAYYSEENDIILLLGRDNDIDADWENGIFRDNFRGVWGAIDGNIVYMELTYECDDYVLFSVPIILNGEECSLRVCYNYTREKYEILGARRGLDDNGMSDKNLITLKPGDTVTTLHYILSLSGDEDAPQQVEMDTFTVTQTTSFAEENLGDGTFVLCFEMVDARNNSMYATPVYITVENSMIYIETE